MRIAVANWSRRKVGGAETYLRTVIPAMVEAGYEVSLICEVDTPSDRDPICMPNGGPVWCFADQGSQVLDEVRAWKPDLIFAHAFNNPALGAALVEGHKGVFYVHDYYGSCISGGKTRTFPSIRPCTKRFGAACLAHFYPRRCGGLNPILAWQLYLAQSRRLAMLRQYSVIATASDHMRREFVNLGFEGGRVRTVSSLISDSPDGAGLSDAERARIARRNFHADRVSLLFVGRMVRLKGGEYLLDALPLVADALKRPLNLIMAGDGPARAEWSARARSLQNRAKDIRVDFRGWVSDEDLGRLAEESHLLVMPSLWPEPFGRAGLEVGRLGVPSVAFAVGGIPEWLQDGVNGHLACGDPASPRGLAEAIIRALSSADHYAKLCVETRTRAGAFSIKRHLTCLTKLFDEVIGT